MEYPTSSRTRTTMAPTKAGPAGLSVRQGNLRVPLGEISANTKSGPDVKRSGKVQVKKSVVFFQSYLNRDTHPPPSFLAMLLFQRSRRNFLFEIFNHNNDTTTLTVLII
jgi:hypothetical protein